MKRTPAPMSLPALVGSLLIGLLALAVPASAQWTRVTETPVTEMFSVWANGDTIVAGADSIAFVSTNGGVTWKTTTKPAAGVPAIEAALVRNGRLYVGTFGKGVFISDNLGTTWTAFNQGLVGGFNNSQLAVDDLDLRGNDLFAGTAGAGVYKRNLNAGTWSHFGDVFEPEQASNINSVALGGNRLIAMGGANGMVFHNEPGETDWTESDLDNVGIHAGLTGQSAIWNGSGWVVGTNFGIFLSTGGQEPWTRIDPGLGVVFWTTFANTGHRIFGAWSIPNAAVIRTSDDNGASWGDEELFLNTFIDRLAVSGNTLYAARNDGLWRRSIGTTSVPEDGAPRLSFAPIGPQPFFEETRLRFELPKDGAAAIDIVDAQGRLVGGHMETWWSAGVHEVAIDARGWAPGVYFASLRADGAHKSVRLVHIR